MPPNNTIESFAISLAEAHKMYGAPRSGKTSMTGILFVVQPNNINICDERPIEYALSLQGVPAYRVEFGEATLASTSLTDSKELLFWPASSMGGEPVEISVVYHRAGYDHEEYDEAGCEARYQLEISRAIKCPSILCHLATLKVVQHKLCEPDSLKRFLGPEEAALVAETFAPIYPLDESKSGEEGRWLATDATIALNYVMKPSLEGGGHNIFREDIPTFLASIPRASWKEYVLMELIKSPDVRNVLLSRRGIYSGPVVSELGIFGIALWRQGPSGVEMLHNRQAGFSFKTKRRDINEMSVVKGYGCFDSPFLI